MKKQYYIIPIVLAFLIISTTQSCYYDVESVLYPTSGTTTCDSSTAKFATFVSPLIASKCATSGCHNATSASAGVNLDGYTNIKNYLSRSSSAFFGSIKHTSGYSSMPQGGSKLADCDITRLQLWMNAGLLNN
jgi:hypothetical protein